MALPSSFSFPGRANRACGQGKTIYSVGHDQISQTVYDYSASSQQPTVPSQFFGTDGHGSVRVLVDAVAAIVRDPAFQLQLYTFDAYGNLLEWTNAQPLTTYLYSGESFGFSIGQQYLRARFYDATTGRFNRLDPFFGNSADPQSFHKYGYVHSDPIHGVDPTGEFFHLVGLTYVGLAQATAATSALMVALNGVANYFHKLNKRIAVGLGGYDATIALTALRNNLVDTWRGSDKHPPLTSKKKNAVAMALLNPITGWDIGEMTFDHKSKWAIGNLTSVNLQNTLSFRNRVFSVSEANYVWYGMLNRLLYEDGIHTLVTNRFAMSSSISAYRISLGSVLGFRSTYWDDFETIEGKIAWAEFGWDWASDASADIVEGEVEYGIASKSPWPFRLIGRVGNAGDVLRVDTNGPFMPYI